MSPLLIGGFPFNGQNEAVNGVVGLAEMSSFVCYRLSFPSIPRVEHKVGLLNWVGSAQNHKMIESHPCEGSSSAGNTSKCQQVAYIHTYI